MCIYPSNENIPIAFWTTPSTGCNKDVYWAGVHNWMCKSVLWGKLWQRIRHSSQAWLTPLDNLVKTEGEGENETERYKQGIGHIKGFWWSAYIHTYICNLYGWIYPNKVWKITDCSTSLGNQSWSLWFQVLVFKHVFNYNVDCVHTGEIVFWVCVLVRLCRCCSIGWCKAPASPCTGSFCRGVVVRGRKTNGECSCHITKLPWSKESVATAISIKSPAVHSWNKWFNPIYYEFYVSLGE